MGLNETAQINIRRCVDFVQLIHNIGHVPEQFVGRGVTHEIAQEHFAPVAALEQMLVLVGICHTSLRGGSIKYGRQQRFEF